MEVYVYKRSGILWNMESAPQFKNDRMKQRGV